jgi:hypothetical protein
MIAREARSILCARQAHGGEREQCRSACSAPPRESSVGAGEAEKSQPPARRRNQFGPALQHSDNHHRLSTPAGKTGVTL